MFSEPLSQNWARECVVVGNTVFADCISTSERFTTATANRPWRDQTL